MKTPLEISKQAASALVKDATPAGGFEIAGWFVEVLARRISGAMADAESELAAAILAAVNEALALPVPSPVSEETLGEIYAMIGRQGEWPDAAVHCLFAHVEHLEACLREITQSGPEADAFARGHTMGKRQGRAEGAKEQREACVKAARSVASTLTGETLMGKPVFIAPSHEAAVVVRAVENAPLVTDTKEAG